MGLPDPNQMGRAQGKPFYTPGQASYASPGYSGYGGAPPGYQPAQFDESDYARNPGLGASPRIQRMSAFAAQAGQQAFDRNMAAIASPTRSADRMAQLRAPMTQEERADIQRQFGHMSYMRPGGPPNLQAGSTPVPPQPGLLATAGKALAALPPQGSEPAGPPSMNGNGSGRPGLLSPDWKPLVGPPQNATPRTRLAVPRPAMPPMRTIAPPPIQARPSGGVPPSAGDLAAGDFLRDPTVQAAARLEQQTAQANISSVESETARNRAYADAMERQSRMNPAEKSTHERWSAGNYKTYDEYARDLRVARGAIPQPPDTVQADPPAPGPLTPPARLNPSLPGPPPRPVQANPTGGDAYTYIMNHPAGIADAFMNPATSPGSPSTPRSLAEIYDSLSGKLPQGWDVPGSPVYDPGLAANIKAHARQTLGAAEYERQRAQIPSDPGDLSAVGRISHGYSYWSDPRAQADRKTRPYRFFNDNQTLQPQQTTSYHALRTVLPFLYNDTEFPKTAKYWFGGR